MRFAHPWFLLGLLALPVLAWLRGSPGARAAFVYSSVDLVRQLAAQPRSRAGRFLLMFRWLALALFIIALARPQLAESEEVINASGVDIVVALDLSGSMESE